MASIYDWSTTAATNASADAAINWAEFQDPDTVNNSARQMMARIASFLDDIAYNKASTGAANTYTVTSSSTPGGATPPDGMTVGFIAHQTNTGPCNLVVDSYGSIPLRAISGTAMSSGGVQINMPILSIYRASTNEWIAQGTGANVNAYLTAFQSADLTARLIKVGTVFPWPGATAPSGYLFCAGQAVSRTTYSELFSALGTTYGAGDGSTTFNLPDYRGRALFGKDNMNGSTAGLVTAAGSGITGTTLGATGGAETVTIAKANLPDYTLPDTFSISGSQVGGLTRNLTVPTTTAQFGSGTAPSQGITFATTTLSITGSVTLGGSSTPTNKMPPAIMCNYIILALPSAARGQVTSKGTLTLVNGLNSNITLPSQESLRISGPTLAFSVGGLTAGVDGQPLRLYNTTSQAMTVVNEDASSTAANRIKTLTGANVTLRTGTSFATLEYDATDNRWILGSTN